MNAMAVTNFARAADPEVFDGWIYDVRSAAEAARGFVALAASISREAPLDWAVAVTFESEDSLHQWLDGATWKHLVRAAMARGFLRLSSDLVIIEGAVIPVGVAIVSSTVSSGMEADFQAAHIKLTMAASQFPGYEGTAIFPPGAPGKWMSLIRFRTEPQLSAWLRSPQRNEVLPPVRSSLTRDFSVIAQTTPFGTTVRNVDGKAKMTPSWKTAMLLLMVLYPLVMLQSRFVAPVIGKLGAQPWLSVWLSPGGQRGVDAMVVDAHGVVMVPSLARPGRRRQSANKPARCRSSGDRLCRVVDRLRDSRGAAVLGLTSRIEEIRP